MHRRDFLKNALLAAGVLSFPYLRAGVLADSVSVPADDKEPVSGDFRKSIMWGTVGMEGSVLDKCKAIKAAGYDGIEPNSHMDRDEVLAAMRETGLVASSVCNVHHWAKPLSHPDAAVRQEGIDAMIVAMEDAKAYGTDAVLLVPGIVNEEVSYDDCWNRSTECIKELIPTAEKLGVKICIENVWNNFLLSPVEACNYVDQFKSPYVKFLCFHKLLCMAVSPFAFFSVESTSGVISGNFTRENRRATSNATPPIMAYGIEMFPPVPFPKRK